MMVAFFLHLKTVQNNNNPKDSAGRPGEGQELCREGGRGTASSENNKFITIDANNATVVHSLERITVKQQSCKFIAGVF